VITEERGFMDRGSAYTWVVDPLDGTSNFAAGLPWFGVIIALMKERLPILGGMFLPVEKLLYLTERGKGSSRNGEAIQVTLSSRLENQLVAYSFDFHEDPAHTQSEMEIMARLSRRVRNIRSTNSLVDFCYVADGRLGAALNQCTKIWDIAVPWLMITEAGGRVSDIHGKEIRFRPKQRDIGQNYTIMASGKSLHPQILELVKAKN